MDLEEHICRLRYHPCIEETNKIEMIMKQYDMLLERSGADTPRIKEVWEYKKVNSNETLNESELNKIGKEGWQLCTAIGLVMSPGNTYYYIYYFKRIKP